MIVRFIYIPLLLLVSALHFYFFAIEAFMWTTERTMEIFNITSAGLAIDTKALAANQGINNLFLALGLLYFLLRKNHETLYFLLIWVIVAGCYGCYSIGSFRIFLAQALPAILAILATYTNSRVSKT